MSRNHLPEISGWTDFDALHDNPAAWHDAMVSIAAAHSSEPLQQRADGSVLVGLLGQRLVIKIYPPFLRDHFAFEQAALARLDHRLSVATPSLVASGERDGWPYLVMTQLAGEVLTTLWPDMSEAQKCRLLNRLGALAAEVHALAVGAMAQLAVPWVDFILVQRARCHAWQQRTGLPEHLLAQLDSFLQGDLPQGPPVILTGEYTPMNLLVQNGELVGMFDFGDGLVGPREYDWLGPLCFLAAGNATRCGAFMSGCGASLDEGRKSSLLRLLLLHRYSNLRAQIAFPDWQRAKRFEELAALIWP
jgi:hygromycin-B 7''-O-kinase